MIVYRKFESYEDYAYKQGRKNRGGANYLLRHLEKRSDYFRKIFKMAKPYLLMGRVLCLGARTGSENLGAIRAGFNGSVGIDLHPVGDAVIVGDWHNIPFPAGQFHDVYSNSLDHCLDLDKLASEVKRVLVSGGRFYVMATNRSQSLDVWIAKGKNEAMFWPTSDDLRDEIVARGFTVVKEWRHGKWGHYIFGVA